MEYGMDLWVGTIIVSDINAGLRGRGSVATSSPALNRFGKALSWLLLHWEKAGPVMIEKTATVRNPQGIHCRPSAAIVKEVWHYTGRIQVVADSGESDLRSLFTLVSLALEEGAMVRIRVSGPSEEEFCNQLVELFERRFDFPPVSSQDRDRSVQTMLSDS
jgi:phosphocarrier protein HPr